MFIRFNVANFLSFDEMQEFSMISGKVRSKMSQIYCDDKIKLLKFAAIFGANASGKSNLISAIDFARHTILDKLPEGHSLKFNKCSSSNNSRKSYFEFEVKVNNKFFSYGFESILANSSITSEWLVELLSNGNTKEVFVRDIEKGSFDFKDKYFSKELKKILNIYANDIKEDDSILFLKLMNQNKDNFYKDNNEASIFSDMYKWIKYSLDINYPDRPISNYSYFMTDDNLEEISKIIQAFGTGITNFSIVDVTLDSIANNIPKKVLQDVIAKLEESHTKKKKNKENIDSTKFLFRSNNKDFLILEIDDESNIKTKTIKFNHGNQDIFFSLSEESDGTVRLLDLLEILLDKSSNRTYLIDEVDRCLHPQLTYKFVETFLKLAAKRNIQLVITTHESRLLDFDLLRRDEIWLVNKNKTGSSKIYSLEEFNTRFDTKIDKAYLDGRYGGTPIFNTIFPLDKD